MRILIAGSTGESMPPPYGGIPKVSLLYARTWIKSGHEVAINFVYKPKNADDLGAKARYYFEYAAKPGKMAKVFFALGHLLRNPGLYLGLIKDYFKIYPRFSAEAVLYAGYGVFADKMIADFKPDVILLEAALIKSFMAAQVARRRKIPVVIDTYAEVRDLGMGINRLLSDEERNHYWKNYLGLAELVLGISNCTAGALLYLPKEKVKVFHDTCDFTLCRMEIPESRQALREYFKLPINSFLIGAVGAFEYRKGHHHLIQAAAILAKQGLDVAVAICGGSGDVNKWRTLATEQGIADRVFFFQKISEMDLAKFFRVLDLYTNLSNTPRSCGLDLALLEGMASGLPIVVYDNGGLPEAVPEGKNGWIVSTDDVTAVAEAIRRAQGLSPEQRQNMGKESAAIAAKSDINLTADIKLNWLKGVVESYKPW